MLLLRRSQLEATIGKGDGATLPQDRKTAARRQAFQELAERYAAELTAQFRTLNIFVQHAGEVGRTHEVFLGQVLARFLPASLRIGTGFVVSPTKVTSQQDVIVYDWQKLPLLLSVGDLVVVDSETVAATIEVKTTVRARAQFLKEIRRLSTMAGDSTHRGAVGLFMWEGLHLEAALECFWALMRERARLSMSPLLDFVYVRGSYVIVPNWDGKLDSAPLLVLRLGPGHAPEGVGLLSLVARMWSAGIQHHAVWPWWLEEFEPQAFQLFERMEWPEDLRVRVDDELQSLQDAR